MRAVEFMRAAMEKYGNPGQSLWPVVLSSLYGAFLAGEECDVRILVIDLDASVHGWAAVLRTSSDEPGIEVVGGYRTAADLLGSAFRVGLTCGLVLEAPLGAQAWAWVGIGLSGPVREVEVA